MPLFGALFTNPIAILFIVLAILASYALVFYNGIQKGKQDANKDWKEKMEKLVSANNTRLNSIEEVSRLQASQVNSSIADLNKNVETIMKKKVSTVIYNEDGVALKCVNMKGDIRLGQDFSKQWNELNDVNKRRK